MNYKMIIIINIVFSNVLSVSTFVPRKTSQHHHSVAAECCNGNIRTMYLLELLQYEACLRLKNKYKQNEILKEIYHLITRIPEQSNSVYVKPNSVASTRIP